MKIEILKELLLNSWNEETCSPGLRDEWTMKNPSLGQCAITALIVNDVCGGKIMRCMASSGSHYYNLIDGEIVDLTVEQFLGEIPDYEHGEERTREYLLGNEDTKNRYRTLLSSVRRRLIDININRLFLADELYVYYDYLNEYYMFCQYFIDDYRVDGDIEHVRIELAAHNTGCFIEVDHHLDTDSYTYSIENFGIYEKEGLVPPRGFLDAAFEYARRYKDAISLERTLTDAHVASLG